MTPRTHDIHIKRIKAMLQIYPKVYFHADGNIYVDANKLNESDTHPSDYARNFGHEEAQYRVIFTDVSQVPESVEKLNYMLIEAKAKEAVQKAKTTADMVVIPDVDKEEEMEEEPKPRVRVQRKN